MNPDESKRTLGEDEKIRELLARLRDEKNKTHGAGGSPSITEVVSAQKNIPTLTPEEELEKKMRSTVIKPLVTYEDDMAETLRKQQESIISINLAEKKRREENGEERGSLEESDSVRRIMLVASIVLVLAGLGIVGYFYYSRTKTVVLVKPVAAPALITLDATKNIDGSNLNRDRLVRIVTDARTSIAQPNGSITDLHLTEDPQGTKTPVDIGVLFPLIAPTAPAALTRAFDTPYLFGIYSAAQNSPFIIVKVASFEHAFAGMLEWEKNMSDDLGPLFFNTTPTDSSASLNLTNILATSTTSSTPAQIVSPQTGAFEDLVIKNKDTRILRDSERNIVLIYSFLDKNTLLITTSDDVFKNVLNKFVNSKLVR